ncbi:MAG: RHS repeat-associated core domain-containing protein [Bacteroidota bacterium]
MCGCGSHGEKLETIEDGAHENYLNFGFPLPTAHYTYDGIGNVLNDDQQSMSYNAFNFPNTISTTSGYGAEISYRTDGSNSTSLNDPNTAEILQRELYYPFGMSFRGTAPLEPEPDQDFLYNGKELVGETGLYDYGARYYDPAVSRWMGVDPLAYEYGAWSPYNYVLNNPMLHFDPDGRSVDGEYEKDEDGNWVKVSDKGDHIGVDFYHHDTFRGSGKQMTLAVDQMSGSYNWITNGRSVLRGESRQDDIGWQEVFDEWKFGTGPERSLFWGSHPSNVSISKHYNFLDAHDEFLASEDSKAGFSVNFWPDDYVWTGTDMQSQMMGSYNLSFYRLGERVLALAQDSKSRQSFYYRMDVTNYSRSEGRYITKAPTIPMSTGMGTYLPGPSNVYSLSETNTYQTYMFFVR